MFRYNVVIADDEPIILNGLKKMIETTDSEFKVIKTFSNGEDFNVPEVYEKLYDYSVDRLLFYSALYEFCGVFELADISFNTITINGEKKGINELILT